MYFSMLAQTERKKSFSSTNIHICEVWTEIYINNNTSKAFAIINPNQWQYE